mmetsp:Transcript_1841/g.5296  ORF Transcript_1841/g.5296 Transcript_1841/m.5296 type:complete len:347 (-) Transcript_1841:729-1769(-)
MAWPLVQGNVDLLLVLVHRLGPIEVGLHRIHLQLAELGRALVEQLHSLPQGLLHLVSGQVRHVKACRCRHTLGDVYDGVHQAARRCDDREGAVLLADHLRQAAWLVSRGHQEDVAPRHHLVLDLGVEAHVPAHPPFEGVLHVTQHVAVALVPVAHHDELRPPCDAVAGVVHKPRDALAQHVDALLPRQPADKADDADVRILAQVQQPLQGELIRPFAADVVAHGVVVEDVGVHIGVPAVVDAVQDAGQAVRLVLRADEVLEVEAASRRLDLLGVVRRHGDYPVGVHQRSFAQVHAVVQLEVGRGLVLDPEELLHIHVVVLPLVAEVVDDIDRPGLRVAIVPPVLVV